MAKRYGVNVHYDIVAHVEVEAETEQEALELAQTKAGELSYREMECVGSDSCITYIEE